MDESTLRALIANLEASGSSAHWWLEFCTALVVLGVVFEVIFIIWEYVDELHDFRRGIVHPPERPNILLFALGLLGAGLVAIGVAGEFRFESKIERIETDIRKANDDLFLLLSKEAGDAAKSAKTARAEADVVGKKADALDIRLGNAAIKLGDIEIDTLAEGPRWRLLERGEAVLINALKQFAGQRVTVVACGNGDPEREGLEQLLLNVFPKAGWISPGYARWGGCPNMLSGGNEIYVVAPTDDSTEWAGLPAQQWIKVQCGRFNISHDAINTLCDVLHELRISTIAFREKSLPNDVGIQYARLFFATGTPDSPAELAYKDPGRIFLLIGPNAPMFADKSNPAHNSGNLK